MFLIKGQVYLPIYQTCKHIGQNLVFATRVNPVLSFYRIQNQIGSHHVLYQGTHSTFPFRVKDH